MPAILWTPISSNVKTGPIPVSTTAKDSCPATCPFMRNGCYAEQGGIGFMWSALTKAGPNAAFKSGVANLQSIDWEGLCDRVQALPDATLWRHNQAGDLPHNAGRIDRKALRSLTRANKNRRGFTYTHHVMTKPNQAAIAEANKQGFTVNLSGNSLSHADELSKLAIAPVVVVLPAETDGSKTPVLHTPEGRTVSVCPATYRDDVTCKSCQLCQRQDRKCIVGFPAHGAAKAKASKVAA
jgi:hypothetical protein